MEEERRRRRRTGEERVEEVTVYTGSKRLVHQCEIPMQGLNQENGGCYKILKKAERTVQNSCK